MKLTAPPTTAPRGARDLYELCPACEGVGSIRPTRFSELPLRLRKLRGRWIECPGCAGARFVKVGLTVAQVERLIAENARLRGGG